MTDITSILSAIENGDPKAAEGLLPLVYEELRKLAAQKLAQEKPGQTLQATALVHEAYLRLVGGDQGRDWNGRAHFFGAAAEAMRRILVDQARRKKAGKHGGGLLRVELPEGLAEAESRSDDLLALDEALGRLELHDPDALPASRTRRPPTSWASAAGPRTASGHWAGHGCSANCRNSWPARLFPRAGRRHFSH
jgi:RNA polymerase sigma factor (TIGR02999 family)